MKKFSKDLFDELCELVIKHHAQDILDDIPVMVESELFGVLIHLRRIDNHSKSADLID